MSTKLNTLIIKRIKIKSSAKWLELYLNGEWNFKIKKNRFG